MIRILCWPFFMLWMFVGFLFSLLGSFLAMIFGLVLILIGAVLTATVIGAIIGIPLILTGAVLMVRSIF